MSKNKAGEPLLQSEKTSMSPPMTGRNSNLSQAISICAVGLLICFFLPWTQFLGRAISGFDLQKLGDEQKFLWLIPVFCAITIIGGMTRRSQKNTAQLTGALPFLVLIYWYQKLGQDVFHILSFGAYGSLFFGLVLGILPRRMK